MSVMGFLFVWTIASLFFGPVIGKCIKEQMR